MSTEEMSNSTVPPAEAPYILSYEWYDRETCDRDRRLVLDRTGDCLWIREYYDNLPEEEYSKTEMLVEEYWIPWDRKHIEYLIKGLQEIIGAND